MITLPNECLIEIFNKLKDYYRFLFSCLLVNRLWCRNVIPILWSDPNFRDRRIIKICLLSLNTEEKAPLIPLKILPSNDQILLFDYTSHTTFISCFNLEKGIVNWLCNDGNEPRNINDYYDRCRKFEDVIQTVEYSLITMLLRTSKKIIYLNLDEFINQRSSKIINISLKSLCENSSITSLDLSNVKLNFKEIKKLSDVFTKIPI